MDIISRIKDAHDAGFMQGITPKEVWIGPSEDRETPSSPGAGRRQDNN